MMSDSNRYLVVNENLNEGFLFQDPTLGTIEDRNKYTIVMQSVHRIDCSDVIFNTTKKIKGVVFNLDTGLPSFKQLHLVNKLLKKNINIYLYWHFEKTIEKLDWHTLQSYWHLWWMIKFFFAKDIARKFFSPLYNSLLYLTRFSKRVILGVGRRLIKVYKNSKPLEQASEFFKKHPTFKDKRNAIISFLYYRCCITDSPTDYSVMLNECMFSPEHKSLYKEIKSFSDDSRPVAFAKIQKNKLRVLYVRLDYWSKIKAGGSYSHTCFFANELNRVCAEMVALMGAHYDLLAYFGVRSCVIDGLASASEYCLLTACRYYYYQLRTAIQLFNPDLIYERYCLGNYAIAKICKELQIPYVLEFNGSEIEMNRSFGSGQYQYEREFIETEKAAMQQATAINVVSQVVKNLLVSSGVNQEKILVNPNGACPDTYKPASLEMIKNTRKKLQIKEDAVVVGFIGSFGGWHGIEIIAEAMHKIYDQVPNIHFLLIGDGNNRHLIENELIRKPKLKAIVTLPGMIDQISAIPLLQACDIYLSPQSSHMSSCDFFGSPIKLFEYMALGKVIIASDLMQIGDVLMPALDARRLSTKNEVTNERGILCQPGVVTQFVEAVVFAARNPLISAKLGANARRALLANYTWQKHVDRLLKFLYRESDSVVIPDDLDRKKKQILYAREYVSDSRFKILDTCDNDKYKKQVQEQWNYNPCGSHYVKVAERHTVDWYLEAEAYRYKVYAPWMADVMGFVEFPGKQVLEIGGGIGTDLAQFAKNGAIVTDLDLSAGHLAYAEENFALRGLTGTFKHGDAENMPFLDNTFDVVYTNGVIHHSPNTRKIISEIYRVLKPGGVVKAMVYAENSLNYWQKQVHDVWWLKDLYKKMSIGEYLSSSIEITENDAKPLVKLYTKARLRELFSNFTDVRIVKRQLVEEEKPKIFSQFSRDKLQKIIGWNLILTARTPLKKEYNNKVKITAEEL